MGRIGSEHWQNMGREGRLLSSRLWHMVGFGASLVITRGNFPGKSLLRILLLMPMVLPVVVLAVDIYSVFLRFRLNATTIRFVLGHLMIALPFSLIIIANGLKGGDDRCV